MQGQGIRGVIFDMDGVLCHSEDLMAEAACRMFAETYGVKVSPDDFLPFLGAGEDRYLGGVAEQHGVRLGMPRDKERAYAIYLELIRGRLRPLRGVRSFIGCCREHGLLLAVATGADRIKLEGNLRELGLPPEQFRALVSGDQITHPKPHPEIFLAAAARLGLPPEACLVVEDSPNGLRAGRAAGCPCLGLTTSFDGPALQRAGAGWTVPDLAGAIPLLESAGVWR